jgi:hypothetical protein
LERQRLQDAAGVGHGVHHDADVGVLGLEAVEELAHHLALVAVVVPGHAEFDLGEGGAEEEEGGEEGGEEGSAGHRYLLMKRRAGVSPPGVENDPDAIVRHPDLVQGGGGERPGGRCGSPWPGSTAARLADGYAQVYGGAVMTSKLGSGLSAVRDGP